MIIGLIDVDGKGTKRAGGGSVYPNLALGKIARFHKEKGDVVEWAKPIDLFNRVEYDIIYASKVFNFSKDVDYKQYKFKKLIKGGTGYDINSKLPREIETLQPLYDIYPDVDKKTAFGFLTRGCPNNCYWCVVPKKEGKIYPYMDVEEIAIEGRTNIVLMDNNILGGGGTLWINCVKLQNWVIE